MLSFEIEVIFMKHLFKSDLLYFAHIYICFENIGFIYKIELLLQLNNKMLFVTTSYTKCLAAMSV